MANDKTTSRYIYTERASYKGVDSQALTEHIKRVQKDVVPKLKEQGEKKETGALRLRLKGVT
jgi:hypothetical protein